MSTHPLWLAVGVVVAATGCGPAEPRVGTPVGAGVAEAVFEHRANGSGLLRTRVVFPADAEGAPRPGPHPAVVFIQGGFVPESRYRWWAAALAEQGFVVALPSHDFQLALFSIDDGAAARALLVRPPASLLTNLVAPERIAVAGHSLGGVVAVKLALQGGFRALLLEASLPDTPDAVPLQGLRIPSLSLAGENDCSAPVASTSAGAQSLPSPTALVVLDGVTHYQFTDSDAEDVGRGCGAGVDLDTAHDRIVQVALAFFGAALGPTPSVGAPALAQVPGAQVTSR